jgi:hypothetical protein
MATSTVVSVGTSPTRLDAATADNVAGHSVVLKVQTAASTVFLGGSNVTTLTTAGQPGGLPIATADAPLRVDLGENEGGLYGVVASGTVNVQVLRLS